MPKIKLSQQFIAGQLHCPEGKNRIEYCDADLPGLYIEVRATSPGKGTYYLRYKNAAGKTSHKKLGRTHDITLAEARKQAKTLKAEIALGTEPSKKAVLTYTELFIQHYLPYVTPRKRSWAKDEEMYRLRLKKFIGDKPLNTINRQQIQSFHTQLKAEGLSASTCNHYIKLIKHSLNLAIDWEMLAANPASRVPLFHEDNKMENYLNEQQLEQLMKVLITDDNRPVCHILMYLLSTGARLNEALSAQWQHIELEKRLWTIPASHSKSKKVRSVPLNDSAICIIQQLNTQHHSHLFINPKSQQPYTTIHKVWGRLRAKAGLKHLRIHDLRHQYASFLVNDGRTLYEVQQILGHSDPSVTQRYAHLSSTALLSAANSASLAIMQAS